MSTEIYRIERDTLVGIADAVRTKEGSTGEIPVSELKPRILALSEGNEVTAEQATPTISVDSAGLITAQSVQEAGTVAAGTVSVTYQLNTVSGQTVTPGVSATVAVPIHHFTTGTIWVEGDANLTAENIKSGVSIFGVDGALESEDYEVPSISVADDGVITATANGLSTETQLPTSEGGTFTPGTEEQTLAAEGDFLTGDVVIAGDTNLVAENIASGVSIFGVEGTYEASGLGTNAHYVSVAAEISQVNTVAYFAWPEEVNLNGIINLALTATNADANRIFSYDGGNLLKLAMLSLTGATGVTDTSIFEPVLKDGSGNTVYDAWGWMSLGGNVNNYPPALAVSADESGLTLNLAGGSLVGYTDQTDYSTALWPDNLTLWIYWLD